MGSKLACPVQDLQQSNLGADLGGGDVQVAPRQAADATAGGVQGNPHLVVGDADVGVDVNELE